MEGGREGRGAERFLLLAAMGETGKERGRRRTEVTLKWLTRDPIYGRLLVLLEGRRLPRKLRQPPCCKHQGTIPIRLVSRYADANPGFSYFKTERSVSFSQADAE